MLPGSPQRTTKFPAGRPASYCCFCCWHLAPCRTHLCLLQREAVFCKPWRFRVCLQGLNNLAVIYTQQGRAQEALQLLQAAVMAAPTYAEAHNNLGVLQVRPLLGGCASMLPVLLSSVLHAHMPAGAPPYYPPRVQRDVGAVHDAVASYRRCLELDPHNRHAGAAGKQGQQL